MIKEEWKKIKGYKDWYRVSNLGRIKTKNWKNTGKEKIMSPALDGKGYLRTVLVKEDGCNHTIKVHRIVAINFISNPKNKPQVNHINSVKTDNRVINLEWCTAKENISHAIENGNGGYKFKKGEKQHPNCIRNGSKNGISLLTEKEVLDIRDKYVPRVYTRKMLANEYNVSVSAIKDIVNRKSWKHI